MSTVWQEVYYCVIQHFIDILSINDNYLSCFIDVCTGSVFWEAKSKHFMMTWSSFNVLVIPDFTGDGIPELVTAHSSDPRFPPEVKDI